MSENNNLVEKQNSSSVELDLSGLRIQQSTKNRRKGYIRAKSIYGGIYYYYVNGKKEKYLGTAETILKRVSK